MNTRTCALCEQDFATDHYTVLCPACVEAERERVRRMGAIGEIVSYASNTLAAIGRLQHDYPDASVLTQMLADAMRSPLAALTAVRDGMREVDREHDKRITDAHNTARVAR